MRPIIDRHFQVNVIWEPATYVKALRLRHGLSARAFATELGFGPALVYRLERENGGVHLDTIRAILTWHDNHQLPRPCSVETCWLGKDHDGPHEDHS